MENRSTLHMMHLFLFLFVVNFCSAEEKIENPTLPFQTPIQPFSVGDRLVIEIRLAEHSGLDIKIQDHRRDADLNWPPPIIFQLEICTNFHGGKTIATANGYNDWFEVVSSVCNAVPGVNGKIEIKIVNGGFLFKTYFGSTRITNAYSFKFPLMMGNVLRIKRREDNLGEATVLSVNIKRENPKPLVFLPRFRDSNGEQVLVQAIRAKEDIMERCSTEAIKKKYEYYWFEGADHVCYTGKTPPGKLPYFQLFPRWFDSCPCTCFSNPDDVIILKLLFNRAVPQPEKWTTLVIEDWTWHHDLLMHSDGKFAVEFFERPQNVSANCHPLQEPLLRVSKQYDSSVADWKYTGNDNTLEVRKRNIAPFYEISTFPSGTKAENRKSDLKKNIGFIRVKGINRVEYKHRVKS